MGDVTGRCKNFPAITFDAFFCCSLCEDFDGKDAFLFGESESIVYADGITSRSGVFFKLFVHLYSAGEYSQQFGCRFRHLNMLLGVADKSLHALIRIFTSLIRAANACNLRCFPPLCVAIV